MVSGNPKHPEYLIAAIIVHIESCYEGTRVPTVDRPYNDDAGAPER